MPHALFCKLAQKLYLCVGLRETVANNRRDARVVEWGGLENRCTLRSTKGSNPFLSANKGVNQQVMQFTPFITPENQLLIV